MAFPFVLPSRLDMMVGTQGTTWGRIGGIVEGEVGRGLAP